MAREVKALESESAVGADGDLTWNLAKDLSAGNKIRASSELSEDSPRPPAAINNNTQAELAPASTTSADPVQMPDHHAIAAVDLREHSQQNGAMTSEPEQPPMAQGSQMTAPTTTSAVSKPAASTDSAQLSITAKSMAAQPVKPQMIAAPAPIPQDALSPLSRAHE